jgi:hypothetical protein
VNAEARRRQDLADVRRMRAERLAHEQTFASPPPQAEPPQAEPEGIELSGPSWTFEPAEPSAEPVAPARPEPPTALDRRAARFVLALDAATQLDPEETRAAMEDNLRRRWLAGELSQAEAEAEHAASLAVIEGRTE